MIDSDSDYGSNEILEKWVNCVVRSRQANFSSNSQVHYCLGPSNKSKALYNNVEFCDESIWIKTYVNTNFVIFCKIHSVILFEYIKYIKNNSS